MSRTLRMLLLLIAATVFSAHLPLNLVVVMVAALAMTDMVLADIISVMFAAVFMDFYSFLPLGFSITPLAVLILCLQTLRSQIYVQAAGSRLIWATIGILLYYVTALGLRALRGDASLYIGGALLWGSLQVLAEAVLAVVIAPVLHRTLTVTLADLRRSRAIVVP